MKRLVMILILALWLPLGVGLAEKSTSIEDEFYDALFNDKGELIEFNKEFLHSQKGQLYFDLFRERFECVQTAYETTYVESPSHSLADHMLDVMTVYNVFHPLQENRYLLISNCQYRACNAKGIYIIDTIGRDFAFAMITPEDILKPRITKPLAVGGRDDPKKDYFRLFLSYKISDELKYKFASLANNWLSQSPHILKNTLPIEIIPIDCRS